MLEEDKPMGDGINRDAKTGVFLPGNKSAKGRIKGSRNKLTEQLLERFAKRNTDGISMEEIMMDIAQDPEQPAELRFKASGKMMDLIYPKAQSVELEVEETTGMSIKEMDDRIAQLLKKNNPHTEQAEEEEEEE